MKFFITILFLTFALTTIAQDPHFSQFFSSPLTLNPAFTGKFSGVVRAAANYRNQWPTINRAYETGTVSVDFNYFSVSTAYHKGLDEDGYKQLGAGFQVTYSNMLINTTKLTFEDQLTSSGFTNPTQEVFNNSTLKSSYIDVNAGILYTVSTTDRNNFYGGVSLYHINRPKQEFTGINYNLYPRATIHAGGYFPVGQLTTLHLSGLFSTQAGAYETVLGGAMQFIAGDPAADKPTSFYGGGWIRVGDAIIPYVGLEFSDLRAGVSYDINMSDLKTASQSRGGIEISLIYIMHSPENKGLPCPKF